MSESSKRATVYFEPELHKALRIKAAVTHRSISDLVNEAVRHALQEDREDLAAFESRVAEPTISYKTSDRSLKSRMSNGLDKVAGFLARQDDLRLGIVFGSLAEGRGNYDSDLDVAVLGERALTAERRLELIQGLARIVGRSVDLVDLKTAGIPVARTALLKGKVVFSRDASIYPAQVSRVLVDSADFLPYRNRLLKQRLDAWIR